MKRNKIQKKLLSYVLALAMVLSVIAPTNTAYAAQSQLTQEEVEISSQAEDESIADLEPEVEDMSEEYEYPDKWLTDNVTVFDNLAKAKTASARIASAKTTADSADEEEKQIVGNVVVVLRFADDSDDIYESRGGYDYIKSQFTGSQNSLAAYINEFSWGQTEAKTHFYPTNEKDEIICYVDDKPADYYRKKSSSNTIGYESDEQSARRTELFDKVKVFMGEDFLDKLGIDNSVYNLTFIVPHEENWRDFFWSHKGAIKIAGKYQPYNFITLPNKKDISRTLCHEFLHSLGFPDLYRYDDVTDTPIGVWSIMASGTTPTVYEKQKYGNWIHNANAIKEITKNGEYSISPSGTTQDNTIAYKIPVPNNDKQYFMIEYRDGTPEGLIFYRINTNASGNGYGPPDEIYVLRNSNTTVANSYFNGETGRTEFSDFKLYNSNEDLGIRVYNIRKIDGKMYFRINVEKEENIATVYYNNNNFNNAYIHYQIGNGSWTAVPGAQMARTTEEKGYSYKYVIDLGTESKLTTCFNNGNGSWDSRNGANYVIGKGVYGIKDGIITEIDREPLVITDISVSNPAGTTATVPITITAEASGGVGALQYEFLLNGTTVQEYSTKASYTWENPVHNYTGYTITVNVKDESGNIKTDSYYFYVNQEVVFSGYQIVPSNEVTVGEKVSLTISGSGGTGTLKRQVEVQKEGESKKVVQSYTANNPVGWTPTESGNYIITMTLQDEAGYTVTQEKEYTVKPRKGNTTTIFYENSDFTNAYVRYKVGNGSWITSPGVEMETSTEQEGYRYKYVIDLEDNDNVTVCFNNGNGDWDDNNGNYYIFVAGTYGCSGSNIVELEEVLSVSLFEADNPVGGTYTTMKMTAEASGGTEPYQYRFGYIYSGKEVSLTGYQSKNSVNWTVSTAGTYTLFVDVKDADGATVRKKIDNYIVEGAKVSKLETSVASPQKVGTSIIITGEAANFVKDKYDSECYMITKDGVTTTLSKNADNTATWTPTKAGNYIITYQYNTYLGNTIEKSIEYVIENDEVNQTTIYYKGYSTPYIHYKIGNGSWTSVPGIAMEATTEQDGYTHKITIDMGEENILTACFNDGKGNWDSRNGANYTFGVGVYGYGNGTIEEINNTLKVSSFTNSTPIGGTSVLMKITAQATGGTAPYQYRFGYILSGREVNLTLYTTNNQTNWDTYTAGTYTLFVDVKDAEGKVVRKTIDNFLVEGPKVSKLETSVASPQKVGTSITITGEVSNLVKDNYDFQYYKVTKDGITTTLTKNADNTATWTPTEAGTYTITYQYVTYIGNILEKSIQYVIQEENLQQTTIYYKGYSTPYIHYKVGNGSWTAVPGVAMEATTEQAGYTHKMTIDMQDATTLAVCFNDGNGNWDSRNGANYSFGVGTYTYSNGTITKID